MHDRVALRAGGAQQREVAVVERAHRRHEPDRARRGSGASASRSSAIVRQTFTPGTSCGLASGDARGRRREDEVELLELRALGADRGEVPLDRLPVAPLDRPGELEAVLDHAAHQRIERLGRRAGRLEQRPRARLAA